MMLIGAATPDRTRYVIACLILMVHVLAWLIWMLVYSWRKKIAYLVGGHTCVPSPRATQPIAFWSVMTFYSLLVVLSLTIVGFCIVTIARGNHAPPQSARGRAPVTSTTASGS